MVFFRKIWAAWAVVLFIAMMLVSLPLVLGLLLFGEKGRRWATVYLHHLFTRIFFALILLKVSVKGRKNLRRGQPYIIVGNHRSALDFIVHAMAFPGVFRFLAKQELLKVPVFGFVVRKMCLIVDRTSAMSRARSVVELKKELEKDWSVFIYPEGSRNRNEAEPLGQFHDGAFRLAIQIGAPVAVCTIQNIRDISSTAESIDLSPGELRVIWSEPIPTKGLKPTDIELLKEKTRAQMLESLRA